MSASNGDSSITTAVHEVYVEEGCVKDDGSKDLAKVRSRVYDAISTHKVLNKKERATKALLRGDLVTTVFPSVVGPEDFDNDEHIGQRPLLEAVYAKINSEVWNMVSTGAQSAVQRMVGMNMGNGYVLCRTKIGKDTVDAVYITDNVECIRLDFTRPDNVSLEKKIETSTRNREMLVLRQPHNAKVYAGEYDKTLKGALSNAQSQIQLAIEAVSNRAEPESDDDESED